MADSRRTIRGNKRRTAGRDSNFFERRATLTRVLFAWSRNKNPGPYSLWGDEKEIHWVFYDEPTIWIDGDTLPNPNHKIVQIKKAPEQFPTFAIT